MNAAQRHLVIVGLIFSAAISHFRATDYSMGTNGVVIPIRTTMHKRTPKQIEEERRVSEYMAKRRGDPNPNPTPIDTTYEVTYGFTVNQGSFLVGLLIPFGLLFAALFIHLGGQGKSKEKKE